VVAERNATHLVVLTATNFVTREVKSFKLDPTHDWKSKTLVVGLKNDLVYVAVSIEDYTVNFNFSGNTLNL